jgi:hypothetical protein
VPHVVADGSERFGASGRDHGRGTVDRLLQARQQRTVCRMRDPEDDEVFAVAPIAEALLQDRLRLSRVGSGDAEVVREQSAQARRGEAARNQHGEPDAKHEPAAPEH